MTMMDTTTPNTDVDEDVVIEQEVDEDEFLRGSVEDEPGTEVDPKPADKPAEVPEEGVAAEPEVAEEKPASEEEAAQPEPTPSQPEPEPAKPAETAELEPVAAQPPQDVQPFDYNAWREDMAERVEGHFAITDEDATLLTTNPQEVLPRMLGRFYADVVCAVSGNVQNMLPDMVEQVQVQKAQYDQDLDTFYGRWPQLDRNNPEHSKVIVTLAESMRAAQPQISKDALIAQVGAAALMTLELPLPTEQLPDPKPTAQVTPPPMGGKATTSGKVSPVGAPAKPTWDDPESMWDLYDRQTR